MAFVPPSSSKHPLSTFASAVEMGGIGVTVPLVLNEIVFTGLARHHAISPTFTEVIGLAAFAQICYGGDRLVDAFAAAASSTPISLEKQALYTTVQKHSRTIAILSVVAFAYLEHHFASPDLLKFLPLLFLSCRYKDWVKPTVLKALFVGATWSVASVAMPLLRESGGTTPVLLPTMACAFLMFAASNVADVGDVIEDAAEGVPTIPVMLGTNRALQISATAVLSSVALVGHLLTA